MRPLVTGFQQGTAFAVDTQVNLVQVAGQDFVDIVRVIQRAIGDALHIGAETLAKTAPGSGQKTFGKDIRLAGTGRYGLAGGDFGGA